MVKSAKSPVTPVAGEVASKRKSGKIINSFDEYRGVLTWNFVNGESLTFDAFKAAHPLGDVEVLPPMSDCGLRAMLHGFKQKISDAGAMSVNQTTGQPPEPSARIAKMRRVAESLAAGQWELERTGGGGSSPSMLIRALAERFGKPVDVIAPWLKSKTKAEQSALSADKGVAKILARMATDSAASSGIDTAPLFAELA